MLDTAMRDIAHIMGEPPIAEEDEFLTISQVAKWLGYLPVTVWRKVRSGEIEALRLPSGHWRIRRSTVEALLRPAEPANNGREAQP